MGINYEHFQVTPSEIRAGRPRTGERVTTGPQGLLRGTKYIDRRAELGDFKGKGKPASALVVLHYLWRHTVRSEDGRGLGPIEAYGWVLTGKSKIAKIATECNLSYNAAGATIKWLRDNGWLGGQHENGIELMLRVRMDMEGHKARLEILGQTVPTAGTVDGDRANEWQGTVPAIGGTVPTVVGGPCQRLAAITGTLTRILKGTSTATAQQAKTKIKIKTKAGTGPRESPPLTRPGWRNSYRS